MAVIHGSNADAFLNGYDVGEFFNNVRYSANRDIHDVTVFNSGGNKEYSPSPIDESTASASGFFDHDAVTDADGGDYALEAAVASQAMTSVFCWFPGGASAVGARGRALEGAITNYEIEDDSGNVATASMEMTSNVGVEPVDLLATLAARVNSFTGTSDDNGAATTEGGSAYLQVTDVTSGTLPVIVEHSTDDAVWSTKGTFSNVTADHDSERIALSGTINRYTRASATGTYSAAFLVAIHRK